MEKELVNENEKPATEPVVIPDECGDSMWDAVLQLEIKVCDITTSNKK